MAPGVDRICERVNGNEALVRRGRYVSLAFLLGVGDQDYVVSIEQGRVASVEPRQPVPKRDHHDLFAMLAAGIATIDGDLRPLMQNLQYFKDVLAAPRSTR